MLWALAGFFILIIAVLVAFFISYSSYLKNHPKSLYYWDFNERPGLHVKKLGRIYRAKPNKVTIKEFIGKKKYYHFASDFFKLRSKYTNAPGNLNRNAYIIYGELEERRGDTWFKAIGGHEVIKLIFTHKRPLEAIELLTSGTLDEMTQSLSEMTSTMITKSAEFRVFFENFLERFQELFLQPYQDAATVLAYAREIRPSEILDSGVTRVLDLLKSDENSTVGEKVDNLIEAVNNLNGKLDRLTSAVET